MAVVVVDVVVDVVVVVVTAVAQSPSVRVQRNSPGPDTRPGPPEDGTAHSAAGSRHSAGTPDHGADRRTIRSSRQALRGRAEHSDEQRTPLVQAGS